jgi:hypothetical protein
MDASRSAPRSDWLGSSHGFRLEVDGRTLGVVDDVAEVVPRAKRVVLRKGRATRQHV